MSGGYQAVATYRAAVQIGPDDWEMRATSMLVNDSTTITEIRDWLASLGVKCPCISGVTFSALSSTPEPPND